MAEADPSEPLYAVAPADFVRERTALAKALKAAGKREEAARIEKLPRPAPSVWAVNQLARRQPALIARLVELTAKLQGHGAPTRRADYAETVAAHREVLKALRAQANDILQAAKMRPTPEILGRVVHDLRAGVGTDESRALIENGRLVRDLDEGTTDPFASGAVALLPDEPRHEARGAHAPDKAARAHAAAREAKAREVKRLRDALADAERVAETERSAWEAARDAAAHAEKRLTAARAKVEAATAKLAAAEADDDRTA
jgi:hypothetical protein